MSDSDVSFDSLTIYRLLVRNILNEDRTDRISNDSDAHARILIAALIDHAEKSVDIFCHQLASDVWLSEEVFSAVKKATQRGVLFRIVTQETVDVGTEREFVQRGIKAKRNLVPALDSNFMIVDRKAFRVEVSHTARAGFAYANKPEFSSVLNNAFRAIYDAAS